MKKVLFVLVLMLSAGIIANAQFKFGIKAGANFAGINDDDTDMKTGVTAGVLGQFKFSERWAIQPEVLFNMQGAKYKSGSTKIDWKFNYVAIPVMVQFYIIDGLSVEIGPQFGILVSAERNDTDVKDYTESFEASIGTGVAYELSNVPVGFFARYTAGLTEINSSSALGTNLKNYAFQLGAFVKL